MTPQFEQARDMHHAGEISVAATLYQQVVEHDPAHFRAWNNLGACFDDLEQFDAAENAFRSALKLRPDEAPILHNLGRILHKQGKYAEAEQHYRDCLTLIPEYSDCHFNLGLLLQDTKRLNEAAASLQQAANLDSDNIATHSALGDVLYQQGILLPALASYQRATELSPHDAYSHFQVGKVQETLQQNELAIESFRRAAELDIQSDSAKEALVRTLAKAGRTDEAITILNNWLSQQPEHALAQHMLAALGGAATPERASDEYVRNTFDRFAHEFDHTLKKLHYQAPQLIAQRTAELYPHSNSTLDILDAGCGTGLCGPLLRPYARTLTGIDLSSGMLEQAQRLSVYDTLSPAELTAWLAQQQAQFDLIISADTLCYLGNLPPVFNAAAQALRPQGCIIFTLEQHNGDEAYQLQDNGRYRHAQQYVQNTLTRAGFNQIDVRYDTLRMEAGVAVVGLVVSARLK